MLPRLFNEPDLHKVLRSGHSFFFYKKINTNIFIYFFSFVSMLSNLSLLYALEHFIYKKNDILQL